MSLMVRQEPEPHGNEKYAGVFPLLQPVPHFIADRVLGHKSRAYPEYMTAPTTRRRSGTHWRGWPPRSPTFFSRTNPNGRCSAAARRAGRIAGNKTAPPGRTRLG